MGVGGAKGGGGEKIVSLKARICSKTELKKGGRGETAPAMDEGQGYAGGGANVKQMCLS